MQNRVIIHQWRDWILEHIHDDTYELTRKDDKSVHPITARDAMDAENKSRCVIKEIGTFGKSAAD